MYRSFFIILVSAFLFIGINTVFYYTIFRQQLDFQTELLTRQTRICGNTIEQEGLHFENELNSIPYQDDFTKLFTDEEIKQRGSVNLQKLYTGYSQLINKITVYDNQNNVYSLILDLKENFVSDYYESQRQIPLMEREELIEEDGKFVLSVPGFDENGVVRSNILVDINFTRFINYVFERYSVEDILWHCLVSEEGELISTSGQDVVVSENSLKHIGADISEENEGSFVHSLSINGVSTQVVSVYYPVRFVKRNMGIVFSIKTDLFLRSIIIKFILITICSLVLLALLLYIYFRIMRNKRDKRQPGRFSDEAFLATVEDLNIGFVFTNPDKSIRLMNRAARDLLTVNGKNEETSCSVPGQENILESALSPVYHRALGPGSVYLLRNESSTKHVFKVEWSANIAEDSTGIIMLVDVSEFENARNLEKNTSRARKESLDKMSREIFTPLNQVQEILSDPGEAKAKTLKPDSVEDLRKSFSLISNLVRAALDFASREAGDVVIEQIPFYLRPEMGLALDPYRDKDSEISLITKIRNEVPDKLVGDPFRLRKAISSLVDNAVKLTSEGRVLVSAEVKEQLSGLLRLQFHVEDTGAGVEELKLNEIIRDLESGKIDVPGEKDPVRLRLAIASQHIELLKGKLRIESPSSISTSPDKPGLRCSFTIDVLPGESIKADLVFEDIQKLEQIKCLVLTQEKDTDNEKFGPLLNLGLKLNYLVYREENPRSVMKLVKEKAPAFHMLIIVHSPSHNGLRLAAELIRESIIDKHAVILLSSDPASENYSLSRNLGIDYYIEDPYEPYHFIEVFQKHFPGLGKEELEKAPELDQVKPDLSILLAEDNLFNRKLIQGLFKRLCLEIDFAENGAQAVQMAKEKKYDIIFMDILMPEMDGMQAAAEIRRQGIGVPIVALTALEDNETRKAAMEAGFDDYLIKPASAEKLRKTLLKNCSKSS